MPRILLTFGEDFTHERPNRKMLSRSINLLVALAAFTVGSFLALNYPSGPLMPMLGFFLYALLVFYQPSLFLITVPALLPVIGFAPWTGWITFEELDVLVLATATGGYARYAVDGTQRSNQRTSLLLIVLAGLMSISILISMVRGFADAGGFVFGWFQGYDGPMNSMRIGKSFFLALLLIPLMARLQKAHDSNISRKLGMGIAIGLGAASLAALWERLAFTDLLNFSSDYRSTALFWEMHVGGAALDGWLLLTIPFAIWALRNSRSALQFAISLGLVGLAAYASLTTFSRGVYLALMVSLPLLAWLTRSQAKPADHDQEAPAWGFYRWMAALVLLGTMASLVFPAGGYRGLLALLGLVAVSLSMPLVLRGMSPGQLLAGNLSGLFCGTLLVVAANFVPKGPYLLYALLLSMTFAALYWPRILEAKARATFGTVSFVCLLLSAANVADFWGGADALFAMSSALSMLFLVAIWSAFSRRPLWPNSLRWQGSLITTAVAVCGVIAVFSGGAYMGERFTTSSQDLDGRLSHWRQTIAMLQSPSDIAFGKGLGRFPANYFFAIPTGAFPGTYQIKEENGNSSLSLVAPRHSISFGDALRVSQRLGFDARGPFVVALKVKAKTDVTVHVEVCEKHLLYVGACAIKHIKIKAANGEWQPARVRLDGPSLSGGPWYAPPLKMFSLAILNRSGAAEIDDVELASTSGPNMLANGGFTNEMQHWFFTSDRDHMPWHAKNVLINLLFDQGMAGVVLFLLLTVCALWRLNLGRAKHDELSPYLTAAITGFLIVGMFDSLTDVPRLAFFYYLLILYALSFSSAHRHRIKKRSGTRVPGTQEANHKPAHVSQ